MSGTLKTWLMLEPSCVQGLHCSQTSPEATNSATHRVLKLPPNTTAPAKRLFLAF